MDVVFAALASLAIDLLLYGVLINTVAWVLVLVAAFSWRDAATLYGSRT